MERTRFNCLIDDLGQLSKRFNRILGEHDRTDFKESLFRSLDPNNSFDNLSVRLHKLSTIELRINQIKYYHDLCLMRSHFLHLAGDRRRSEIFFDNRRLYFEIFEVLTWLGKDILKQKGYGEMDISFTILLLGNIAREDWITNEVDWVPTYHAKSDRTSTGKHLFGYIQEWKATASTILEQVGILSHVERINTMEGTISDFSYHKNLKHPGIIQSTKMLNGQYLCGDIDMANRIITEVLYKLRSDAPKIVPIMISNWGYGQNREQAIKSLNLKQGDGRLRRINQICWLGRLLVNVEEMNSFRALKALYYQGILTTREEHQLQKAFLFFTDAMYQIYLLDYPDFTILPASKEGDMGFIMKRMQIKSLTVFYDTLKRFTLDTLDIWENVSQKFLKLAQKGQ